MSKSIDVPVSERNAEQMHMKLQQVSDNCYAVLCEKNRVMDANSGLINIGDGMVVDTQSDLPHARMMIELFGTVWNGMPKYVALTHEDADHVGGNQLFAGADIIAHRSVAERMPTIANPEDTRKLLGAVEHLPKRLLLEGVHHGAEAMGLQLAEDYDLEGVELVLPTTLFDDRYELDLGGTEVHMIHVGPCHEVGDTIVHVPKEEVVFAGDIIFHESTPMGWVGTYDSFFKALDLIISLNPKAIVPGHGPICGVEGVTETKEYFQYVRTESRKCFDDGMSSLDAAKKIDFGPYGSWKAPARLYMNVERAYREFRNEPADAAWDKPATFDAIYKVAKAKGVPAEF
jgi:cyclase